MARNDVYVALGELIEKYRGTMSQATVAQLLSDRLGRTVSQATVSAHENGQRWGDNPELIGAYAAVLGIPTVVMQRTIGLPAPDDNGNPPLMTTTLREIVEADPTLSDAAKEHLVKQYGLLQAASAHGWEKAEKAEKSAAPARKRQGG